MLNSPPLWPTIFLDVVNDLQFILHIAYCILHVACCNVGIYTESMRGNRIEKHVFPSLDSTEI
jgi:hypothetical protein